MKEAIRDTKTFEDPVDVKTRLGRVERPLCMRERSIAQSLAVKTRLGRVERNFGLMYSVSLGSTG